jgi:hypothetical protein
MFSSYCNYPLETTNIFYRPKNDPQPLVNFMQLLPIVCSAYVPFKVATYCLQHLQTFYGYYLPFVMPSNHLWLLLIICITCIPFVVDAYHLQQHYLPYRPQIPRIPLYCYLKVVAKMVEGVSYSRYYYKKWKHIKEVKN